MDVFINVFRHKKDAVEELLEDFEISFIVIGGDAWDDIIGIVSPSRSLVSMKHTYDSIVNGEDSVLWNDLSIGDILRLDSELLDVRMSYEHVCGNLARTDEKLREQCDFLDTVLSMSLSEVLMNGNKNQTHLKASQLLRGNIHVGEDDARGKERKGVKKYFYAKNENSASNETSLENKHKNSTKQLVMTSDLEERSELLLDNTDAELSALDAVQTFIEFCYPDVHVEGVFESLEKPVVCAPLYELVNKIDEGKMTHYFLSLRNQCMGNETCLLNAKKLKYSLMNHSKFFKQHLGQVLDSPIDITVVLTPKATHKNNSVVTTQVTISQIIPV